MQLFTMSLNYPGLKLMIWEDFPEPGGKIQEAGQFHEFRQHSFMSSAATGDLSVHEMRCGQQFLQQDSNILQAKNQGKKWYKIAFKSLLIPPCQVICSIPLIEFGLKSELHNNGLSAAHRAHCTAGAIKHMNSHDVQSHLKGRVGSFVEHGLPLSRKNGFKLQLSSWWKLLLLLIFAGSISLLIFSLSFCFFMLDSE